jgi:signal peptidase I
MVRAIFGIAETLLATLIIFILLQAFVGRTYAIEQTSMEGTLEPGQRVVVDELTPRFDPYKRGDIIVFSAPPGADRTEPLIKRIIGMAGDRIQIKDGGVFVNGTRIDEPYLYGSEPTLPSSDASEWTIPPGEIFVMGDHRAVSLDSRVFGPIPLSTVIGRAWLRFYPITSIEFLGGS